MRLDIDPNAIAPGSTCMDISSFRPLLGPPGLAHDMDEDWGEFERRHGIQLPAQYKQFMSLYGREWFIKPASEANPEGGVLVDGGYFQQYYEMPFMEFLSQALSFSLRPELWDPERETSQPYQLIGSMRPN